MSAIRLLPVEEWGRLLEVPDSPFARATAAAGRPVLPDPHFALVLVEENRAGEIVGTWMLTSVMLLEGLWRREDVRGDAVGARHLLFGMLGLLKDREIKTAITVIQDEMVAELARKVGFQVLPGGGTLHTISMGDLG